MLAYFHSVWLGTADPFWPHLVLILTSVSAGIAVGAGIIFEGEKYSPDVHRIATKLVIVGIFFESLSSVCLFVFDERISAAQQDKIIALEIRLAPRVLTREQFEEFKKLRGKVTAVSYMASPGLESAMFGSQLAEALSDAGIAVTPYFSRADEIFVGTRICAPKGDSSAALLASVLHKVTGDEPQKCTFEEFARPVRTDVPLILVGERPLFFPNGTPSFFRFREYPDAEKKVKTP